MQLMQQIEPNSINIKNNMSTLGEAIENNQINGAIADKGNEVCGIISPNKNDGVSNTGENMMNDDSIKEQFENKVNGFNGIVKTNGDAQTLSIDSYKIETQINVIIDNGSSAISQSNGSSSLSKSCESTNINSGDIDTTLDKNTNLENRTINLHQDIISSEKAENISPENVNVSLNEKELTDIISIENKSVDDAQVAAYREEVSETKKSEIIENSIDEKMAPNVPAFSPNSDTNEEINISAQLQHLENDATIEDDSKNHLAEDTISASSQSKTLEKVSREIDVIIEDASATKCEENTFKNEIIIEGSILNDKRESPVNDEKNLIVTKMTVTPDVGECSQPDFEEPLVGDQDVVENIALELNFEITPTDDKLVCSSDIPIEGTPSVEKGTEEDVVNEDIDDITNNTNENMEISNGATNDRSSIRSNDNNMVVDDCKPVDEQKQECNKNSDTIAEKVQKYITCKKFSDMVYPVTPSSNIITTESIEDSDVSDNKLNQLDQDRKNIAMEVDASDNNVSLITSDNNICLDTSDTKPLVLTSEIEIAKNKTINDETMEHVSEEKQLRTKDQQKLGNEVMEIDTTVMEIKDEIPLIEKSVSDIVDKDETENKADNVEICEKSSAVINIIDKDSKSTRECSSVKKCDISDIIPVIDSVNYDKSVKSQKSSSDVEFEKQVDLKVIEENNKPKDEKHSDQMTEKPVLKQLPVICKLSNTMDILSDDEDDLRVVKSSEENKTNSETPNTVEEPNKCINIDDDDDIMFIEDTNSQDAILKGDNKSDRQSDKAKSQTLKTTVTDIEIEPYSTEHKIGSTKMHDEELKIGEKDSTATIEVDIQPEVIVEKPVELIETQETKPLITKVFLKTVSKNLADMTRNELEDFCILKLVESVVDKSNLSEIKNKMKTMAQTVEDLRKKAAALTKQNRDLQVVVKTVQEDQKKRNANPMMPMKITRSVGMQVVLSTAEKSMMKKKLSAPPQAPPSVVTRPVRNMQSPKIQKPIANNIPVPRLVPASSPTVKSPITPVINTKPTVTPARNTTPQRPEKRPHNKQSPASSVTVDLTDDEPPAKINTKNPTPPVRLVPSQNLMAPKNKPQFAPTGNSPRKVYIPISSSNPNVRQSAPPSPTVIKNFLPTPRLRPPSVVRMQTLRVNQLPSVSRHPAPLPDAMKQYQPPAWKGLPPAPDLKLSKVDNGIVISWKFEGYQPETYEEISMFQLYAYQETTAPPSTALWKKIGDIKALPLPMACTLTQFMSGFKYYFAVRAIDVRSRIGPFSLPGSILLISKS